MGNKKQELIATIKKDLSLTELYTFYHQHNVIFERVDLFRDFAMSLTKIIASTYLGDDYTPPSQQLSHFQWCWNKVVEDFKKEHIYFQPKGVHFRYFCKYFNEMYYDKTDKESQIALITQFWLVTFSYLTPKRHIDLNVFMGLYKLLNKNLTIQ